MGKETNLIRLLPGMHFPLSPTELLLVLHISTQTWLPRGSLSPFPLHTLGGALL